MEALLLGTTTGWQVSQWSREILPSVERSWFKGSFPWKGKKFPQLIYLHSNILDFLLSF